MEIGVLGSQGSVFLERLSTYVVFEGLDDFMVFGCLQRMVSSLLSLSTSLPLLGGEPLPFGIV